MLALNCAKRESTAEASGSANTPSVITTAPDQKQTKLIEIYARWSSILTEMPTSGELKSGDPLFFTTPPPWKFNEPFQHSPPLIYMGMTDDII